MNTLNTYLLSKKVSKGSDFSHTSLLGGSFFIPVEDEDYFFELYTQELEKGNTVCLTEKQCDSRVPIIIDLDFRQESSELHHKYTDCKIQDIIACLMNVIDEYLHIPEIIHIFVLTKPTRREGDLVKDGIHIIIPEVVTPKQFHTFLRNSTYKTIGDILQPCMYTNSPKDIYDNIVGGNKNWLLYGSKKPKEPNRWVLTHLYSYTNGFIRREEQSVYNESELPQLLSIRNKYEICKQKLDFPDTETLEVVSESEEHEIGVNNNEYIDLVKVITGLNDSRACAYNDWSIGCWAIFNYCHDQNVNASPYIHMFSRKCDHKYDVCAVDKFVNHMAYKSGGTNVGTLMFWLKQDNPTLFKELTYKELYKLLGIATLSETHHDIARVIHCILKNEFVYSKDKWYMFKQHRWIECTNDIQLGLKISSIGCKTFSENASYYNKMASHETDESKQKDYLDKGKKANKIAQQLKMSPFKKNILSECRALFLNEDFYDKLDSKPNLLGFDNGVYDLDAQVFREGLPDDYLTMTCGYDYDGNVESMYMDEIINFVNSIMPNKAMVHYVLTSLGYSLHGVKTQEFFQIWTGTGGNGKGLMTTLLQCALGQYYYEPDSKIYTTSAKSSSGANPEIYAIKGKRVAVSQEMDALAQIRNAFIKSLTGNDKLQARELFQKKFVEFIPQCLPIICCNEIPRFESYEGGIARRINVVPFIFKFVENPIMEHHKQIDMTLKGKFRDNVKYYQAFMNILIDAYRNYVESGSKISKPNEVVEMTKQYMDDVNVILSFVKEHVEITNNNDDMISTSEFNKRFASENSDCDKKNNTKWIKSQMQQNGFTSSKNKSHGEYRDKMVYYGMKWKKIVNAYYNFDDVDCI